ncbi:tetratricopeptide repeat-containing sensor histidine kinase [Dyadobacter sp. CY323]|uniref:sensor histidine kinase n=1 Tax=Dyadobacter sp. CY323 TaxID=2907302 RepID=UPI001F46BD9D|nr:tetratricopeptide repeat-containing sensor histidine kinase [Dyadobacter sp. CY323]MCE6992049.1 tetratricopeptide repeat-containing sensor histidine kinase [Dyadobacter sp. CY323]
MNRLYLFFYTTQLRIILIHLLLLWNLTGCQRSVEPDHGDRLKTWIDSLDRSSRRIGIKKAVMRLDSFMAAMGKPALSDRIQYYKFMKVLSHRDSTLAQNALIYTDSLLQLFSPSSIREKYPIEYSKALLLKGDDLLKQREFYQAYRNYYNGKSFLTGLGEICECARYSSRIANISFKEGNYYQAIEYWKQELKELSECREPDNFQLQFIEKQGSLRNIGIAHLFRNEPEIALRYFQQAMDFIDKHAPEFPRETNFIKFARLVIKRNQAEAYALKGETKVAERLIKSCLEHDNEIDWSLEVEKESRVTLARLYIDSKRYSRAEEQLSILKSLPGASDPVASDGLYRKLEAAILFGQGKFEDAGKLLIANMERDRIEQLRKNAENKSDVGQLLQQIQRQHEIELATEKDAREELILKFAILISITLSVIVYLIWRNALKTIKNIKAVTKLNKAITQRNIVLQDTVNALEQAEIENEAVLRIVAHDLRSPIAAMISASHLVFWEHLPTEDQLEIITAIQDSGDMANALIGQILQSSSDREKISKIDVALQEIVQSCIDMLQHKANEKQQVLDFHYEEVTVPVDREKIWRVFCNLLSNAIKFSEPGSTVWVNLERKNEQVVLSVRDNGIGIPENLKDEIFLPSNKARRSGTAGEQSFGIGLSICRQIVDAHGGRIWFESAKGAGTTFFVQLPV